MRRTTLAWLVVTAIAALVPNATTAQLNTAHLIGVWAGDWKVELAPGVSVIARRGEASSGAYQLIIDKVNAGKVYGRVHQEGVQVTDFKFVGKLEENVLSSGGERFQTSLTIYGEQMKGTRFGGQRPWLITLQKKR